MRRLAGEAEMTFEVLVERHAVAQQILDALACLAREQQRNFLIDDAGPGAIVSAAWSSALSPSASAAAMPPCAHRLDAPSPKCAAEMMVTGRGASLSAVNRPASPAPTTIDAGRRRRRQLRFR